MRPPIEELARGETPAGTITLRRRTEPTRDIDVYEVKLGDEYLMSSLFTVAEIELARLGLAAVEGDALDVVVGGLGLGYTAHAVLEDDRVASLAIVDAVGEVIDWHVRGLLPGATELTDDPRSTYVHGDFFAMVGEGPGFDLASPCRTYDAIIVDIDHTPDHVLHPSHAPFYTVEGLRQLGRHLRPGGVFALWSDEAPEEGFLARLGEVFADVEGHVVPFANFLTGGESINGVYVARGFRD